MTNEWHTLNKSQNVNSIIKQWYNQVVVRVLTLSDI